MWQIPADDYTPPSVSAVYFLFLPTANKCLHSTELGRYQTPSEYYGDPQGLSSSLNNPPLIPVDAHLALSLDWITIDELAMQMPYINDSIKACLKLIKDIKEEEHGNDKEGL